MKMNQETMYWKNNKDWYTVDHEYEYIYIIKDTAPERAKKSYELWLKYQKPRYTEEELLAAEEEEKL